MSRLHSPSAIGRSGIIASTLVFLLALGSCATLRVGSDYDRSANFTSYRTFAWMPQRTNPYESPNPLVVQRAHDAIQAALTAKGYQLINDQPAADLVVDFTIGSRDRIDIRSYPAPYEGPWFGRNSYWWGEPRTGAARWTCASTGKGLSPSTSSMDTLIGRYGRAGRTKS